MKKREKISYIEKTETVYVAFDGKEFNHEYDCLEYEDQKRIDNALSTVPNCEDAENLPNPGYSDANDNHSFYWFRPRDTEDIRTLEEAFRLGNSGWGMINKDDVGKWICIEYDWESGDSWVTSLEGGINSLEHTLGRLGYDVVVTEKKSGKRV